jgi:predicted cupin superfamily sugar epimerase
MLSAEDWIQHLGLQSHPEGGYYRETYRSSEELSPEGLPSRFPGYRSISTAIYFLLRGSDKSLFHRIKSDELWHFHAGDMLTIYVLGERGIATYRLGDTPGNGEHLQVVIPGNHWFGAMVGEKGSYTLAGCTVAPGFDFQDFELADRNELLREFPMYKEIIFALTK